MIQRIQTLWLLLATLVSAILFSVDIYSDHILLNGVDTIRTIRVMGDHYPTLILGVVITLIPLIAMFMFKNRKQQRAMTLFGIVATIGFIAMIIMRVGNLAHNTPAGTDGQYHIWAALPVVSIILMIMAVRGINRDEKLVKSLDRLR